MPAPSDQVRRNAPEHEVADLFREHSDGLRRLLRTLCGSPELADDLASRTFEEALHGRRRGAVITWGWLATVARRRLIDHWRRNGLETQLLERIGRAEARATTSGPFLVDPSLCDALARLEEPHRRALVLRYLADRPLDEVAAALGRSPSATESLIRRARAAARNELTSSGSDLAVVPLAG